MEKLAKSTCTNQSFDIFRGPPYPVCTQRELVLVRKHGQNSVNKEIAKLRNLLSRLSRKIKIKSRLKRKVKNSSSQRLKLNTVIKKRLKTLKSDKIHKKSKKFKIIKTQYKSRHYTFWSGYPALLFVYFAFIKTFHSLHLFINGFFKCNLACSVRLSQSISCHWLEYWGRGSGLEFRWGWQWSSYLGRPMGAWPSKIRPRLEYWRNVLQTTAIQDCRDLAVWSIKLIACLCEATCKNWFCMEGRVTWLEYVGRSVMIAKLAFLTVQGQVHEIDETTTHQGKVHEPYTNVHTKNIDVTNETISGNAAVMSTNDCFYIHCDAADAPYDVKSQHEDSHVPCFTHLHSMTSPIQPQM